MKERRDAEHIAEGPVVGGLELGAEERHSSRAFRRMLRDGVKMRKLSLRRLFLIALPVLLALGGLMSVAARGLQASLSWLQSRPGYQMPFLEIALEPEPPAWIAGGAKGLLRQVLQGSGRSELLSTLAPDFPSLAQDFQRESPWVLAVQEMRVEGRRRIVIQARYREPVALVHLGGSQLVALDQEAVVLPLEELDRRAGGLLVEVRGAVTQGVTATALAGHQLVFEPRPRAKEAAVLPKGAESELESCRKGLRRALELAAFLREECGGDRPYARAVPAAIHIHGTGLFVEIEGTLVHWSTPGDMESAGRSLTDSQKWGMLEAWARSGHQFRNVRYPSFLAFDRETVVVRAPRGG